MYNKNINKYFDILLCEAKKVKQDIPVAAMVVKDDEILSLEVNQRESLNLTTAHAEILALTEANKKLNSWRLYECDMYVTLEPCPMCAWAIINSRIKNLYFGSFDIKYGAFGSVINLAELAKSKINVFGGIKESACDKILDDYFKDIRNAK